MTAPLIIPALGAAPGGCQSVVPAPAPADATVVVNDGWFPDLPLATFRTLSRIREVPVDRQREAILGGMIDVGNQLAAWAAVQRAAGHAKLADVPAIELDGESRLVILYRRAVFASAKADLVERYRDVDQTGAGQRRVDELDPAIGESRRDVVWAVRDIMGATRTFVELI